MRTIRDIRTFEDQDLLQWMAHASLAVVLATIVVGAAVLAAFGVIAPGALDPELGGLFGQPNPGPFAIPLWLVALAACCMLALPVHELAHAVFFKLFAPAEARIGFGVNRELGMLYTSAEGVVYTRRQYLVIALAPTVAVTVLLVALGVALAHPLLGLLAAGIHLSGCTGDWAYVCAILGDPAVTHCEDMLWGIRLLGADGDAAEDAAEDAAASRPEGGEDR